MKLKKKYRFDNKRQIWRIIPNEEGRLIIEEREPDKKNVFFHCLQMETGKKILSEFRPDESFWIGIESVKNDLIYFHKFAKPDMPKHKGIFAFDINSNKISWENPNLIFQFILQDKLYAFLEKFEGRTYFSLNPLNGEIIEELGEDHQLINSLREQSVIKENSKGYLFPEIFETDSSAEEKAVRVIESLRNEFVVSGKIENILKDKLLLISFHLVNSKGSLNNLFRAVDLSTGKYILEEVLNKDITLYLTDSFFVKDDLLFLLFGKSRLEVYKILF